MPRTRKTAPADTQVPLTAPPARTYRGWRGEGGTAVTVSDDASERPLELRLDLRRHSPTGFGWGYAGSGPAQLALALAADALGDDARAKRVYQRLKASLVTTLPADGWELTADQVRAAVAAIEQGRSVAPVAPPADDSSPAHPVDPPATDVREPSPPADLVSNEHPPAVTLKAPNFTPPAAVPDRPDDPPSTPPDSYAAAVRPTEWRVPNPFGIRRDEAAGVRLLEDRRFRQMQLAFAEKPPEEVRVAVGEEGYRWLRREQVWAKPIDKEHGWQTRAEAEDLFERVAAMLREAKGITHEHA